MRTNPLPIRLLVLAGVAALLAGCESTVDMPRGTSEGYRSAMFIAKRPGDLPDFADNSAEVNQMIQSAIAGQFQANGLQMQASGADLTVAYLLIIQNNTMTTSVNDYYGYGGESAEIEDRAHTLGVIEGNRRGYFEAGAIVVDVIDNRTGDLVYRNYARRDIVPNVSDSQRRQRISGAVAEALAPFFAAGS